MESGRGPGPSRPLAAGDPAVAWLLRGDPAVAALARRDLRGERVDAAEALRSPIVRGLLAGRRADGGFGVGPYHKWTGGHWRLVSLVELGIPAGHDGAVAAASAVLDVWADPTRLARVPVIDRQARPHASQEGNAVAVACRLGLADDERVRRLVDALLAWQWDDGGWNCDRRPAARRSSFHETLCPLRGLTEYAAVTRDAASRRAADRAAELLLSHEVVFASRTGEPIHPSFAEPHYPPYWHYDVLQALVVLHRAGHGADPRTARARDMVAARRRPDGRWRAGRRWWGPPGSARTAEAVDWAEVAHQMVTLNALRVGAGAGPPDEVGATRGPVC